ncbi:MAG: hypothetical protein NZR01_02760 [Bryobacteraceae bacterium]|nr:hypothetical protein [Bryobacteraceae bacterium]
MGLIPPGTGWQWRRWHLVPRFERGLEALRIAWILADAMITVPLPARNLRLHWSKLEKSTT